MNSKILSPACPLFCNPSSVHSTPQLPMNCHQPLLPHPNSRRIPNSLPNDQRPTRHPSPVNVELENELDNIITLQQQIQNPNTLTTHHLSQSVTSSNSSNPTSTFDKTRAHRVFKRKHPNTSMLPNPRHPRMFPFTDSTLKLKKFYIFAHHTFQNILTIRPLTTINKLTLTNIPCFPHIHGHHTTISLAHYQFHYIITRKTMKYVKFNYTT